MRGEGLLCRLTRGLGVFYDEYARVVMENIFLHKIITNEVLRLAGDRTTVLLDLGLRDSPSD